MARSDAKPLPIYGVAHRESGCIINVTTGQVITGGLSSLEVTGSLDGGAFASTGLTVTEIGTTGFFTVDIDATRMTCNTLILKVTEATANSADWPCTIYPSAYYLPATDATNKAVLIQDGTGTGMIDTASGKVRLASDGLDSITVTETSGRPSTFPQFLIKVFGYLFNRNRVVGGTQTVYNADGTSMVSGTVTAAGIGEADRTKLQ